MSEKEKLRKELEEFRKEFGLTEEEVESYIELFYKEKPKSNRILNSGGSKPK